MKHLNFKKYSVYIDNGHSFLKAAIPARNEAEARKYVEGNGEVIAVKEITEDFPISVEKVAAALSRYGFGQTEIDLITRTLLMTNIAD